MKRSLISWTVVAAALLAGAAADGAVVVHPSVQLPPLPSSIPIYRLQDDPALENRFADAIDGQPVRLSNRSIALFRPWQVSGESDPVREEARLATLVQRILQPAEGEARPGSRKLVMRQEFSAGNVGQATTTSSFTPIHRYVSYGTGLARVDGPSSRAVFQLHHEAVLAAVVQWKKIVPAGSATLPVIGAPRTFIRDGLRRVLGPAMDDLDIVINRSPEIVYVERGDTLEPVARVSATLEFTEEEVEQRLIDIPLRVSGGTVTLTNDVPDDCTEAPAVSNSAISFDCYVSRDRNEWLANAQGFRSALRSGKRFVPRALCRATPDVLSPKSQFADGTAITLVEAHGAPGRIFIENPDRGVFVSLDSLGGYGATMRLLILHSCSVIATSDDHVQGNDWTIPWSSLFAGLHTVIGYRGDIERDDGVSVAFAAHLEADLPMIRSWFALAAAADYDPTTRHGLPAAVTVRGDDDDAPSGLEQRKNPGCLVAYWLR